ncbi:hypothetical protein [Domibacillus tundrae]|uniref:hypothetical protein n=1 Tax=Domibacillus tundrae TaxID=1587527 RepID=UPI000A64EB06|nr:hypothetical protein [Domibacillus tundrae]
MSMESKTSSYDGREIVDLGVQKNYKTIVVKPQNITVSAIQDATQKPSYYDGSGKLSF